jgi:hypothetical protein
MRRVDDLEPGRVSHPPDHTLRIGGHELAMPIEDCSLWPYDNNRVVDRAAAELGIAFVHAAYDVNSVLDRSIENRSQIFAAHTHRIGEQCRMK